MIKECKRCGILIEVKNSKKYCDECCITAKKENKNKYQVLYKQKTEVKEKERVRSEIYRKLNKKEVNIKNRKYMKIYNQRSDIKERSKEYHKKYRQIPDIKRRTKEYRKEYDKIYYSLPMVKEKRSEHMKKRRQNPDVKEKTKEYNKKYRSNHKNREKRRKYKLHKYHNNLQHNVKEKLRCRFNKAKNKYTEKEQITISKNKNINYQAIFEYLKPFPKDLCNYDMDHIIPLAFFDLTNEEQIKKAWNPINFQWLKSSDNSSKNDKIDFEKYPEQEKVFYKLRLDKFDTERFKYSRLLLYIPKSNSIRKQDFNHTNTREE